MIGDMSSSSALLLASLRRRVPKQTFDTWFGPLTVTASASDRILTFFAPNTIVKEWVVDHYTDLIEDSLRELSLDQYRVQWSLSQSHKDISDERSRLDRTTTVAISGRSEGRAVDEEAIPFIETTPSALNDKYTFS